MVIAIALALNPKLIIMDEPTTALDVVVEREIMEELYDLKEKFGFSVLFISHDLSLMGEISDRIGVMYAGRLVELGTAEQIMNSPQHPYTKASSPPSQPSMGPRFVSRGYLETLSIYLNCPMAVLSKRGVVISRKVVVR